MAVVLRGYVMSEVKRQYNLKHELNHSYLPQEEAPLPDWNETKLYVRRRAAWQARSA